MSAAARRCAVSAVVLALLTATACGGSGDDVTSATTAASATTASSDAPTTAATSATTSGGSTAGTVDFSEEEYVDAGAGVINLGDATQARCLAQAVVDAVGVENLQAKGVTPEQFAETGDFAELGISIDDAAADMAAEFTQCGDLVEAAIAASELVDPQAACLREFFNNDLFAETIIVDLLGIEASQALTDARTNAQQCAAE